MAKKGVEAKAAPVYEAANALNQAIADARDAGLAVDVAFPSAARTGNPGACNVSVTVSVPERVIAKPKGTL